MKTIIQNLKKNWKKIIEELVMKGYAISSIAVVTLILIFVPEKEPDMFIRTLEISLGSMAIIYYFSYLVYNLGNLVFDY